MTLPEILTEICAAQEAARLAGATDDEVSDLRREIINSHRKATTGADYANAWQPDRQLPPERDEPEAKQQTFGNDILGSSRDRA